MSVNCSVCTFRKYRR